MKTIITTLTLALTTFFLTAQTEAENISESTSISVIVPVQSNDGNVVFGLYDETSFMKQPLVGLEGEIKDGKASVTFTDIAPGTYAVLLFHDKNGNKQMDFEPNGMPTEPYGVSNNVMTMGPPLWSDAKFNVTDEPVELEIRM
ncbi:DUF2141 domain-containing protein [Marixanthomonas spongiae]|uniref:DUF2141 domain-containing protein n=1 Tax=Marixanthomonas spongiae TaxID=2174845 RepID=A0A2U0I3L0_9FLAO|nr:DUF2141 domain-containing protein [Marixanthomonas spongiae]PVW15702.1 hypothetical protein DDV96_05370 [Marixanthomonas spongiae]